MPKQTSNRKSSKTVVRSTNKSFKKWQVGLVAVVVLALVGGVGTYIYSQQQKKDLQAKAAAFVLRPQDYAYKPVYDTKIAICQNSSSVYGLVSTSGAGFANGYMRVISSTSSDTPTSVYITPVNSGHVTVHTTIGDRKVASTSVKKVGKTLNSTLRDTPWIQVYYERNGYVDGITKAVHKNFIPYC